MEIRQIDTKFAVTGQLSPEDISAVVTAGYKTLICNRPDGESPDQPEFAAVEAAATQAGLKVYFIPVAGGKITQDNIDDTINALRDAPTPILAYCRSGTRCTNLYGIVNQ